MNSKFLWFLLRHLRQIWVRIVTLAVLALVAVLIAQLLAGFIPPGWSDVVGASAVDQILGILAASMLAVTTFSLSIAVSAFTAAAGSATPRATALLQEDSTTQTVLATFLGTFLFSLVGIIALNAGYYSKSGVLVLFVTTCGVIAIVVVALLHWINYLMVFGRIENTLDKVEVATAEAFELRLSRPWLGGTPQTEPAPGTAHSILSKDTGYVQHIDMRSLSDCAGEMECRIWVAALPGSFVHEAAAILHIDGSPPNEPMAKALRAAVTCGRNRNFDQDPRFGMIVLAEIASRALSPAVNDPGTAIGVIGRILRVLSTWRADMEPQVEFPNIIVPPIQATELIDDAFRPIARDGAGIVEVQIRLHTALRALADIHPATFASATQDAANYALARTMLADLTDDEHQMIKLRHQSRPAA